MKRCLDCAHCSVPRGTPLLDAHCELLGRTCLSARFNNQGYNFRKSANGAGCGSSARRFRPKKVERAA